MFPKIKREIDDKSYEQNNHQIVSNNVFSYKSSLQTLDIKPDESPPKKKIKNENECRDPRLRKLWSSSYTQTSAAPKIEVKPEVNHQSNPELTNKWKPVMGLKEELSLKSKLEVNYKMEKQADKEFLNFPKSLTPNTTTLYDNVLQEIFQWSPDWLQGSISDKPPLMKFEHQMRHNGFKYDFNRDEYVSRHLPYILRGLFTKLSDTFKNEAPSRSEHSIFINDYENTGHLLLNRLLICYMLRDIRKNPKPVTKVNDVITVSLSVVTGNVISMKKYFGIISSHSMLEINDLDEEVIRVYENVTNSRVTDGRNYLLWDKLTILTKRAQNSTIRPKRMSKMDVLLGAGFELRLIKNLLDRSLKCTKLISNILSANANIHQFSEEELNDFRAVGKTLTLNASEMIIKSNPMVFFKGVNSLMVVDISDSALRFEYLSEIVYQVVDNSSGKNRILVITKNEAMNEKWLGELNNKKLRSHKQIVKPWYVNRNSEWTKHSELTRFVTLNARKIYESLGSKLRNMRESEGKTYQELVRRKDIYQDIKECRKFKHIVQNQSNSSSFLIAREDLNKKGYEKLLNESNVIIGTFYDVINCQQLLNEKSKPFDSCIIDDCHQLSDSFVMSILHLGVNTMIIAGDSDHSTTISDTYAMNNKYNISLFERIIKKCLKLT